MGVVVWSVILVGLVVVFLVAFGVKFRGVAWSVFGG